MTPKIKEFAEKRQLKGWSFYDGILIGAEFAEWLRDNGRLWEYHSSKKIWVNNELRCTTTELLDIFLTEKMKENEGKNN